MHNIIKYLKSRFNFEPFFTKNEVFILKNSGFIWKIYCCSSFSYLLIAILNFSLHSILWILQSIFSFQNDVNQLGKKSIWHILDRLYAPLNLVVLFVTDKTIKIYKYLFSLSLYFLSIYFAYNKSFILYLISHTSWHIIPVLILLFNK